MNTTARLATTVAWVIIAGLLLSLGAYIEIDVIEFLEELRGPGGAFAPMALFFATVNLNVVLLFVLVFLVFRNGVKLVVDRRRQVLGSSLRTKLVTSFLFFSLLPTVILLYISTKFVNANFDRWLPADIVQTTQRSLETERAYRESVAALMEVADASHAFRSPAYDFSWDGARGGFLFRSPRAEALGASLERLLREGARVATPRPIWLSTDDNRPVIVRTGARGEIVGLVAPASVHARWQALSSEFSTSKPGVELVRLSYYAMLGVLTLLVVFSATWLGFTIARELTIPIQVLAAATEAVAQGNYNVRIDDIVSDDELGSLARSFRSMVSDLNAARERADRAAAELMWKADELSEKSEYNAILLRDINAAVITCSPDRMVESWNQESAWLFEVSEERALGARLEQVLPPAFFVAAVAPLLARVGASTDARATGEFAGRLGGEDVQLQVTVSLVMTPKGEADTVIFINDITELARAQRIAAWRDVARRIAHEIKNPLTPIKLGAQRLRKRFGGRFETADPSEGAVFRECLDVILHSTESIKGLVDEFIRFARMPQPVFREGDLRDAVRMAVSGFEGNAEHVAVILDPPAGGDGPTVARFDHDQVVRLCANLLSNAIAASAQEGEREVRVTVAGDRGARCVRVEIADRGPGIPEELRNKIFEPYFSTKRTGMGLGLVIVQQIVGDHGGRLDVRDNPPRGAVFVVELPTGA